MKQHAETLVDAIHHAALSGRDLISALAAHHHPQAQEVAARLRAGETLPQACVKHLGPELAQMLAGPRPSPAESALLVGSILRARNQRRSLMLHIIAYPVASILTLVLILLGMDWLAIIDIPWTQVAAPLLLAAVMSTVALGRGSAYGRSWQSHAQRSEWWQQCALILRWQLTEEQAQRLFGPEPSRLAAVTGASPAAIKHCQTMIDYYHQRATRGAERRAHILSLLIQVCGGSVAILVAIRAWTTIYTPFN